MNITKLQKRFLKANSTCMTLTILKTAIIHIKYKIFNYSE